MRYSEIIRILAMHGEYFQGDIAQLNPSERNKRLRNELDITLQRTFLALNEQIIRSNVY